MNACSVPNTCAWLRRGRGGRGDGVKKEGKREGGVREGGVREGECNKEGSGETCMHIEEYITIVTNDIITVTNDIIVTTNDNHHSNQ